MTRGLKRKRVSEELQLRDASASAPVIEHIQDVGSQQPSTSGTTAEPPPSPVIGDTVECKVCKRNVSRRYYSQHLRSNVHKNNCLKFQHAKPNVELIEAAFGNRLLTYRIVSDQGKNNHEFETPELFFERIKKSLNDLIDDTINQLTIFKVSFILHAEFIQETKGICNFFDFNVLSWTVCKGDDKDNFFENLKNSMSNKVSNFEKKDSGWSLKRIKYIDMNINQFNPLRGSSYIDLPHDIKTKKAIINVQNYDHECLKWAILSALYPVKDSSQRVSSYIKNQNKLKFADIPFPVKLTDIHKVEKLNNISINVFGLCFNENLKSHEVNGPLYFTKCRKSTHINLLYLSRGNQGHYCYIKNLSRLVSHQISTTKCSFHICDGCLLAFYSNEQLVNHQKNDCSHVVVELPNHAKTKTNWFGEQISSDKLIFDKYQRQLKLPFVVYADFEAFLNPIASCDPDSTKSYTNNIQKHEMYSFGYYIKCSFDDNLSRYCSYTGSDCAKVFMDTLYSDLEKLNKFIRFRKNPTPMNQDDLNIVSNANKCFICDSDLKSQSVFSYDWTTGKFQGVAHKSCDYKFTPPTHVPVFFHNLSNYDAHFIVKALNFREGAIDIIPQNKEKYISFSKQLKFDKRWLSLRFVDSFRFMSSSLDSLAKNLQEHQFHELRRQYPRDGDFKLLKQKGIFPYEFMKSYESLEATSLPKIEDFYSSLTDSCITIENYQHAQNVWNNFNCRTMLDYSNLYLKTDVLLLTDIFENFRSVCIETYDLDPGHYFTAPGLSWDAMLKITGVQLELLTDFDKVSFIKKGLRGGISQCSNRYAKSNNYYMQDFDSKQPTSYLIYLDANNLYGWAMSQHLPIGEFQWVDPDTDFRISKDADYGYILEVDLEYPDSLHDSHSDLPFCPEHIIIGESKQQKLVPNLNNKMKYIIHYRNLVQCLENGLNLIKVHRILKFKQTNWLQKYIDLNTTLRTSAKTDFEKDFYKLMNNAVFGKTMENIEKRVDVKLLTNWTNHGHIKGIQSYIARPEFHSISIFSESLAAVQLKKTKLIYNKPIYLGFCILDISKTLMYNFHYEYMKKKFEQNVKLLYTDTDSFIYQIFTEDFYDDIKQDLVKRFDTSDFEASNIYGFPCINKKKLGFFKDENKGKILNEFVGLRSKMYALNVDNNIVAKAKGVNKCVTKQFQIDDYKRCLNNKQNIFSEMCRFRSIKHVIFTQKINKISLSHADTKRYLHTNSFDTIAWGHYKLRHLHI